MSSQIYAQMPVVLAQGLGYYDEEGLDVTIENVHSNTKAVHALSGGSADVSTGTVSQVLSLTASGRDVKSFSTMLLGSQVVLVASPKYRKKINGIPDLRGAAVGVGGLGGPAHLNLNYLLAEYGVPASEVTTVTIGTMATAVAAVEHSKVDAAILNDAEYLVLKRKGVNARLLVDTRGRENTKRVFGTDEYPTSVLISTGTWLREQPETARKLARAIARTMQWMHGQAPASILAAIPERYRGDREVDLEIITSLLPMFSETGRMPAGAAEAVRRVAGGSLPEIRVANFDVTRTYTNEFVLNP
jgi:NitT/TauT family transport system substrate-binding protein